MGTRSRACHRCSSFCHREECPHFCHREKCKRRGDLGHFPCHSERSEESYHALFATEILRSLRSLRMTQGEGLAMTQGEGLAMTQGEGLTMTQGEGLAMTPTKLSNATP